MLEQNKRGEWVVPDGSVWHRTSDGSEHPGEWLKCEHCNPVRIVRAEYDDEIASLREAYASAKAAADRAEERLKSAKGKLQTALFEAAQGAVRSVLYVDGYKPMNLVYTEPWRVDSKRLQAEQPAVYVEYAKRGSQWTLSESRGGGA